MISTQSLLKSLRIALIFCCFSTALSAQRNYTNLTDPGHIQSFTEVADAIVCQCGCNLVLSTCPHVECPFAIPVRRFIELKVKQGLQSPKILYHIENGFGSEVLKEPMIQDLQKAGRQDLVQQIVRGFGPKIRAKTSSLIPILFILLITVLGGILGVYWYRRRPASKLQKSNSKKSDSQKETGSETLNSALDKIKELDQ